MRLEDIILAVVNLIILALLEIFTLSVAWFFEAVTGVDVNYMTVGVVAFVLWSLWAALVVLTQIKTRRDDD